MIKDGMFKLFVLGISTLTINSCSSDLKTTSAEGLVEYMEDTENDVKKSITKNGVTFNLAYEPLDLLVQKQQRTQLTSKQSLEELKKDYPQLEYYNLEITSQIKNTREHLIELFNEEIMEFQYYSDFYVQQDIYLVQHTDTIRCSYLHREVAESITNSFRYLLGFENASIDASDRIIVFKSKYTGVDQIEFLITNNSIVSIPQLKTE